MLDVVLLSGKENMDVRAVHKFLSEQSYWAKDISFEMVDRSLSNSFCIGAFIDGKQIAFGRVITDYYTFGWFADFYVLPDFRGQKISKLMLSYIMELPWSKRLRRKMLNTSDGHGLYRQFGFTSLAQPDYIMEIYKPGIHLEYRDNMED